MINLEDVRNKYIELYAEKPDSVTTANGMFFEIKVARVFGAVEFDNGDIDLVDLQGTDILPCEILEQIKEQFPGLSIVPAGHHLIRVGGDMYYSWYLNEDGIVECLIYDSSDAIY